MGGEQAITHVWHQGYWGPTVRFYGGINHGADTTARCVSNRWSGNQFQYNTAVTPVNRTVIHNVYVDKTVIVNSVVNNHELQRPRHTAFTARPTAAETTARARSA